MRTQPNQNIQSLLKVEFVKRFEAMMRQELALHAQALSSYQKEMQSLKDSVQQAKSEIGVLFRHTEVEIKDSTSSIQNRIDNLELRIKALEIGALDQRSSILSIYQSFNEFIASCVTKDNFENYKIEVDATIKDLNDNQTRGFQDYQQHMKYLLSQLIEEQKQIKSSVHERIDNLEKIINQKYDHFKMDKDGISKEIRVYEKTIFIIEKKIENIYTLIERINKRGEVCHKQA
jgi:transposase